MSSTSERYSHTAVIAAGCIALVALAKLRRSRSRRTYDTDSERGPTVNFVLKPWSEFNHHQQLVDAMQDGSIAKMTLMIPYPYTITHAQEYAEMAKCMESVWFIEADGNYAGSVGIHRISGPGRQHVHQLGYYLAPQYRGKGLMTAAVGTAIELFRSKFPQYRYLEADIYAFNRNSARVLEKNGFTATATLVDYYSKGGEVLNAIHYCRKL